MNDQFTPDEEIIPPFPELPIDPELDLSAEAEIMPEITEESEPTAPLMPAESSEASDDGSELPDIEPPPLPILVTEEEASSAEVADNEDSDPPVPDAAADEVTEIIYEALTQQEMDTTPAPQLTPEETEQVLDELIESVNAESNPAPEAPAEEPNEEPAAPQIPQRNERPVRKGRPKRCNGSGLLSIPHLLSAAIWLLIIVAIGVTLGRTIWVCAADVLAFGRESKEVTISVTADDTMESIADKLHDAGLINIPKLFLLYADLTDVEEEHKITTGTFTLNTVYDYMALVSHMGPRATNRAIVEDVLIPEGFNCRQIFALLEEKGICKAADLEAYAASGELDDYWFLEGVERGDKYCLEGFLFPDTYDFYENSTPKLALEKMLDGFQYRFSEDLKEQIPVLNERISEMMRKNGESEEYIAANQLTLRDILTVASLIEEETASNSESYRIASVIYNRLYSWGNTPRYLNIDATLIYALGGKSDITTEDKAVDSPYNTYTNTGLTPGPISNPGLASIHAALNFEDTSYYYYVLNPEVGSHDFSKTLAEHEAKVKKYNGGN